MNIGDVLQVLDLAPVASVTANGNGTGVDLKDLAGEIAVVLDCSNPVAGTAPTMDIKIQESSDNSTFTDVSSGAFTQVTDTGGVQKLSLNKDELKRYIRAVKTIGGSASPQYLVSVKGFGIKKYPA